MKVQLFAMYDRVTGRFSEPFTCPNKMSAVRRFNFILTNAKECADDCALYYLGTYDLMDGSIEPIKPDFVCNFNEDYTEA